MPKPQMSSRIYWTNSTKIMAKKNEENIISYIYYLKIENTNKIFFDFKEKNHGIHIRSSN